MNSYLKKRVEERAALADSATALLDKCADADRDPSADEQTQLDNWKKRVAELDAEIKNIQAQIEANTKFAEIVDGMGEAEAEREERKAARRAQVETRQAPKSIGQRFIDSEAFKAFTANGGRGSSGEFQIEGFLENRAAITTDTVDVPPYLYTQTGYQLTTPLLNAFGKVTVSSKSVEWFTWGGSNAELVPEGELKPEATITPTEHTDTLDTYAHYKPITRQALEDIPQIQSIVEGKLRDGLGNALEAAAATALTSDTQIPSVVNADLLAGIRLGIGEVQSHAYQPTVIVMNPSDYAQMDLDAAAGAGNGPVGWTTFWGLPVVSAGAVPAGTAYVGDLKTGATWFDRNTTGIYMTDSHADNFVRNILVILAEQRALFAVTEPLAIAKVTTEAPAPGAQSARRRSSE